MSEHVRGDEVSSALAVLVHAVCRYLGVGGHPIHRRAVHAERHLEAAIQRARAALATLPKGTLDAALYETYMDGVWSERAKR